MRVNAQRDSNEKDIVQALERIGAEVYRIGSVKKGCPDLLVFRHKKTYAIEVKTEDGELSPKQKENVKRGAFVVRSVHEAFEVMTL